MLSDHEFRPELILGMMSRGQQQAMIGSFIVCTREARQYYYLFDPRHSENTPSIASSQVTLQT